MSIRCCWPRMGNCQSMQELERQALQAWPQWHQLPQESRNKICSCLQNFGHPPPPPTQPGNRQDTRTPIIPTSSLRAQLRLTVATAGSDTRTQPPDSGATLGTRGPEPAATEPPPDSSRICETEAPATRRHLCGTEHWAQKQTKGRNIAFGHSHMRVQVSSPTLKHRVGTPLRLWARPCLSRQLPIGSLTD